MRELFEVREYDGAGRRGELDVPSAGVTVETPALMPVVNPHVQTVPPARLESAFGAQLLITNAYILQSSADLREPALDQGVHDFLDFSGVVVTDSGSFQLAEYGDIDVTTEEILRFQRDIGSDVGTPVDIPTPPDATRERAVADLETTQERLAVAEDVDTGEMLVNAPVQGGLYPDLRERAARAAGDTALDLFPIGAVVPLLKSYRFDDLVDVVAAAKRGLDSDAPVHLFGAGHPMTFALAAALGCDLFDSAAYALYARDDRYLTVRGTEQLDELLYFPCECPVCTDHTPAEVREAGETRRHELLAEHNLAVSFGELRRIRQAIRRGNLFELVETRARSHPAMVDGYRALLDHGDLLEATDPVSKDTFFYLSPASARRPEVDRHHDRLARLDVPATLLLTAEGPDPENNQNSREGSDRDTRGEGDQDTRGEGDQDTRGEGDQDTRGEGDQDTREEYGAVWRLVPPFGPVPKALSDVYPLTAECPDDPDRQAYEAAATGVVRLAEANSGTEMTLRHDGWPGETLAFLPDRVVVESLGDDA